MSKKKKKAKQQLITKWIKENRHLNLLEFITKLNRKLVGMYAYYGINGMLEELYKLYHHTIYMLYSAITRRSQRKMKWNKLLIILERLPIAKPKIYKNIWCWNA